VEEDAAELPEAPAQEQLPAATGDGATEQATEAIDPTADADDHLPF